ncbi:SERINE/THREONINE-PROTEIN KINASE-LIKE PROTEIN CCR4 [Salix koriyanagi]|uniref:non-specific serine/threonine protein kinase n=1 Tax=Salix koriyanagi TaxID=2511006 RepID=A0A9Q1A4P7_9ROSI|nr:SERINE/THREONINE-PROTEIN KINASE-LIKE PROTEIN CCR4 [Salix koriyanagi]
MCITLSCLSFPSGIQIPLSSNTSFTAIVGGDGFLCGLKSLSRSPTTSTLVCWRFSVNGANMSYKRTLSWPGALSQLAARKSFTCGLINDTNSLECWSRREFNSSSIDQKLSSIAVGEDFVWAIGIREYYLWRKHACAINFRRGLDCWGIMAGEKPKDSRVPPPTPFEMEAVICTGYLAADCVTHQGRDRPSMADAVNRLDGSLAACMVQPAFAFVVGNQVFDTRD